MKITNVVLPAGWSGDGWDVWRALEGRRVTPYYDDLHGRAVGGFFQHSAWSIPAGVHSGPGRLPVTVRYVDQIEHGDIGRYVVAGYAGVRGMPARWYVWGRCMVHPYVPDDVSDYGPALVVGRYAWARLTADGLGFTLRHGIPGVLLASSLRAGDGVAVAVAMGRCARLPVVRAVDFVI